MGRKAINTIVDSEIPEKRLESNTTKVQFIVNVGNLYQANQIVDLEDDIATLWIKAKTCKAI